MFFRFRQGFGLTGIAVGASFGLLPVVNVSSMNSFSEVSSEIFVSFLFFYVCYLGSLFGAEYPDIDSPGSIPARKHYFIRRLFKLFQVKHRGVYSHDFISLLMTFGGLYLFLDFVVGPFMRSLLENGVGNAELTPLVALFRLLSLLIKTITSFQNSF